MEHIMLNKNVSNAELIAAMKSINQTVIKTEKKLKDLSYFQIMALLGNVSLHTGGIENTAKLISFSGIDGDSKILEVGCGTGATTSALLRLGMNVTVVEPSSSLLCTTLDNAYKKGRLLPHFYNIPVEDANDLKSDFYDLVLLECVFGFIKKKEAAVSQIQRILKQGGKLIITDFFYHTPPHDELKEFLRTELEIHSFLSEDDYRNFFKNFSFNYWETMSAGNYAITDNQVEKLAKASEQYGTFPFNEEGISIIKEKLIFWESGFSRNRKFLTAFNAILEKPNNSAFKLPLLLNSERLILRVINREDHKNVHQAIKESYADLKPWVQWNPDHMLDENNCETWCIEANAKSVKGEELHMLIIERETQKLVGLVGLYGINWQSKTFHIGYWCVSGFSGNGYITEAVKVLTEHLLEIVRASKIYITTDEKNTKSWKLAERTGFTLDKIVENERLNPQGKCRNTRIYSITGLKT